MPTIETDRMYLRVPALDDLQALYDRIYSDAEVMRYLPGGVPRPLQRVESVLDFYLEHWREHRFGCFMLEDKESGKLIGQAGLQYLPESAREVEVFYALGVDYWGRGLATEAARAAARYGFEEVKLTRLVGLAMHDNHASQKVLKKLGMRYVKDTRLYNLKLKYFSVTRRYFKRGRGVYLLDR